MPSANMSNIEKFCLTIKSAGLRLYSVLGVCVSFYPVKQAGTSVKDSYFETCPKGCFEN